MGYLYDKMKEALDVKGKYTGGVQIKNWSPNMYRCIVMGSSYIFVAKFNGQPKYTLLDPESIKQDLIEYSMGKGKGAIHNLLTERQFSCLEEIYFDTRLYRQFTTLFDIEAYSRKAINSASRLRYYGYCNSDSALSYLMQVYSNCDSAYCLAKDSNRPFPIEYKEGTKDWYKNHNLRPQYYSMDREGGWLDIYFKKCEKQISELVKKAEKYENEKHILEGIYSAMSVDAINMKWVRVLYYIPSAVKAVSSDEVVNFLKSEISKPLPVGGLTRNELERLLSEKYDYNGENRNLLDRKHIDALMHYYDILGVYDKGDPTKSLSDSLQECASSGFFKMFDRYDRLCLNVADYLYKKDATGKLLVNFYSKEFETTIPDGKFRDKYIGGSSGNKDIYNFIGFLSNVLGVNLIKVLGGSKA